MKYGTYQVDPPRPGESQDLVRCCPTLVKAEIDIALTPGLLVQSSNAPTAPAGRPGRSHRAQALYSASVPLLDRSESPIGIGAIVRVEESGRVVYGVVTDGFAYSDLVTPMHAVIGADGDPVAAGAEPTARAEVRLYAAAVLRQIPEEPLQPVPLGPVWLASDTDVVLALRMDAYTRRDRPTGIPVGLYAAGGSKRRCTWMPTSFWGRRRRISTSLACPVWPRRRARSSSC